MIKSLYIFYYSLNYLIYAFVIIHCQRGHGGSSILLHSITHMINYMQLQMQMIVRYFICIYVIKTSLHNANDHHNEALD